MEPADIATVIGDIILRSNGEPAALLQVLNVIRHWESDIRTSHAVLGSPTAPKRSVGIYHRAEGKLRSVETLLGRLVTLEWRLDRDHTLDPDPLPEPQLLRPTPGG